MAADPKIHEELDKWKLTDEARADCVAISNALSDGPQNPAVHKGLEQLDRELAKQMDVSRKRAMGTVLRNSEQKWGINVNANNGVRVTALRSLLPDEFAGELRDEKLIKDPGALPNHGEYTHRIQWYIVHETHLAKNDNGLLRLMGAPEMVSRKNHADGLWDCIFDRLRSPITPSQAYIATGETDFRCPEHFNIWLAKSKAYPSLCDFLKQRFLKRHSGSNQKEIEALESWMRQHQKTKVCAAIEKHYEEEDEDSVRFAILYALKKAGKTVASASITDMDAAVKAYEGGFYRR